MKNKKVLWLFSMMAFLVVCGCGGGGGGGDGPTPPPVQAAQLRIVNNCTSAIWIQNLNMPASTPQVTKLEVGGHVDYSEIPAAGLASTRFWAKTGCDASGQNCEMGQNSDPCPAKGATGCAPPVDSKFEATWGCTLSDQTNCAINPSDPTKRLPAVTSWDTSAVDGYTLPFKVAVISSGGSSCTGADCSTCTNIDCSKLSLDSCPTNEDLSQGRTETHTEYASEDLRVKLTGSDTVLGCYSPCKKMNYASNSGYNALNLSETSDAAIMYCCPSNPADPANYISPTECRAGPVAATKYVAAIHSMCPGGGVYAYSYDDVFGLHNCKGGTQFLMTYCS